MLDDEGLTGPAAGKAHEQSSSSEIGQLALTAVLEEDALWFFLLLLSEHEVCPLLQYRERQDDCIV